MTRSVLPQLDGGLFLTDGGIETVLIFQRGIDLPEFAAFTLLAREEGTEELRRYYDPYLEAARQAGAGFVLESPTWRANPVWAAQLGIGDEELAGLNRRAIELMAEIRDGAENISPIVISGCVGPQGDGYNPKELLSAEAAAEYHSAQIGAFAGTAADQVTAITMTYANEAIGIVRAAQAAGLPAAISFTLETDGRLPDGTPLDEAVAMTDEATGEGPAYYMLNCAHPTHFAGTLPEGEWRERILGLRANASTLSHAELDEATELDDGDPEDLGRRYADLRDSLTNLTVLGGCCGTDHRHIEQIAGAWTAGD